MGKLDETSNFPSDHRSDESSTGYSFMGCSPAEPMSASPVAHSFSPNPSAVQSTAANRNLSLFTLSQHRGPLQDRRGTGQTGDRRDVYLLVTIAIAKITSRLSRLCSAF